ncbi:MAG: phosphatidylethanolamine N-methyltransferase family protein [Planctomycetes bacterium]|nr:phosphatidylethanolamine N-methyltransferase family protein [Planctomycetota bacterium]
MLDATKLGLAYGLSEVGLALVARARARGARSSDRGSLALVWVVIALALPASIWVARNVAFGRYERSTALDGAGLALFVGGVGLRGWAIAVLGRFFTVDVAIHTDHELVRRGPYRLLRHPSYTGALLAFLGLASTMQSVPAVCTALVPILLVLLWRIRVEEQALAAHFGSRWAEHCAKTWRLLPCVW